jgi:hypothetical protein
MHTTDGKLALLRATHRRLTAEMRILKRELRERVGRMEAMQRQLDDVERAERDLTGQ